MGKRPFVCLFLFGGKGLLVCTFCRPVEWVPVSLRTQREAPDMVRSIPPSLCSHQTITLTHTYTHTYTHIHNHTPTQTAPDPIDPMKQQKATTGMGMSQWECPAAWQLPHSRSEERRDGFPSCSERQHFPALGLEEGLLAELVVQSHSRSGPDRSTKRNYQF